MTRSGLLHYREDARSLAFTGVTLLLLLMPLAFDLPTALAPAWIAVSALFCFNTCIVNHNHVHKALFRSQPLNSLLGAVLTVAKGHTSTGVIVAHNLNHHRYHGAPRDWIRTELAGHGPGLWRLLRYTVRASLSMARGRNAPDAPRLGPVQQRQLRLEQVVLAGFVVLVLTLVPYKAALFIGVPWLVGMASLVAVNLLQHDGCDPASRYNHSRNFTGRLGNWLFLNNGYHTVHHRNPGLHWSRLAEEHARIRHEIDPRLDERSILGFLLRHYIFAPAAPTSPLLETRR